MGCGAGEWRLRSHFSPGRKPSFCPHSQEGHLSLQLRAPEQGIFSRLSLCEHTYGLTLPAVEIIFVLVSFFCKVRQRSLKLDA